MEALILEITLSLSLRFVKNGEGGGVAIVPHRTVKCVHLKEFDVDGLFFETVWADVMVDKIWTVVGSVYIHPVELLALNILDTVIGNILQTHQNVIIAMDANSRNVLWDDKCIGIVHPVGAYKWDTN